MVQPSKIAVILILLLGQLATAGGVHLWHAFVAQTSGHVCELHPATSSERAEQERHKVDRFLSGKSECDSTCSTCNSLHAAVQRNGGRSLTQGDLGVEVSDCLYCQSFSQTVSNATSSSMVLCSCLTSNTLMNPSPLHNCSVLISLAARGPPTSLA